MVEKVECESLQLQLESSKDHVWAYQRLMIIERNI